MLGGRGIEYKNLEQMRFQREAALVVNEIHESVWPMVAAGVTPAEVDQISSSVIARNQAKSNFRGYHGYPATICISVGDTVVHGIPDDKPFKAGELVSFDCGAYVVRAGKSWHGDSCFSMIVPQTPLPLPSPNIQGVALPTETSLEKLNWLTRESMWAAIAALAKGRTVACVGEAVESVVEDNSERFGFEAGIVEEFIGHGIGTSMHQAPDVLNYRASGRQAKLRPGMVLCIEPILTLGSAANRTLGDGWTVKTADGKAACHWECQVAILPDGIAVLNLPDLGAEHLERFGVRPSEIFRRGDKLARSL